MRAEETLYEMLGVAPDATVEQVRHAYRAAARRTHPDAGGSSPAFERVAVAYRVLGDPDLRRRYDLRLAAGPAHPCSPGASSATVGPEHRTAPGRRATAGGAGGGAGGAGGGAGGGGGAGTAGRTGTVGAEYWTGAARRGTAGGGGGGGAAHAARGPGAAPATGPLPGADPVVRRRYLAMMVVALSLFISAGTVVRLYSLPAAMIMMVIAAMIPPVAVTVAGRPRRVPPASERRSDAPSPTGTGPDSGSGSGSGSGESTSSGSGGQAHP